MPKRELSRSLKSESGVDRNLLRTCIITIKLEQLDAPKPHKSLSKTEHLQKSVGKLRVYHQLEVSWPACLAQMQPRGQVCCCTGSSLSSVAPAPLSLRLRRTDCRRCRRTPRKLRSAVNSNVNIGQIFSTATYHGLRNIYKSLGISRKTLQYLTILKSPNELNGITGNLFAYIYLNRKIPETPGIYRNLWEYWRISMNI